jgi:outer membrane protein TolC
MKRRIRFPFVLAMLLAAIAPARAQQAESPRAQEPAVRLAELVAEAERVHPSIRAAERRVEAKRHRVSQARALPDPQIHFGYVGDPAPFKTQANDPSSFRQFGVMQEIPYPGKRDLRGRIAAKEADAEAWSVELARRRVRAEVKTAYYELAAVRRVIELTRRNKELLEKLARIAEEKYRVGRGLQQDVIRAQVEVTRVLGRLTVLEQRERTAAAQMNSLLLRPLETPFGPLADVEKSPLNYSLEELVEKAVANHPEVRRQQELMEQNQLAADLARREFYPDFSVGWDYMNRTSGMPEMYGLRFTMNIPLFNKQRRRDAVSEAGAMEASARSARETVRTALLFQVKEQYLAARAAEELLKLYEQAVVPQSALALESSMGAYQTGTLDFLSLLTNFSLLLDYETNLFEERASYQKALARLEELSGVELDAPQAVPGAPEGK